MNSPKPRPARQRQKMFGTFLGKIIIAVYTNEEWAHTRGPKPMKVRPVLVTWTVPAKPAKRKGKS